jgi:hypothetical protein
MNKMPGFTAEKSIDKTSTYYHTIAIFGQASGYLQPAQIGCNPCMNTCCACKERFPVLSGSCKRKCNCPMGCSGVPGAED